MSGLAFATMNPLFDVLGSFSIELLIFAATFFFAFVLRTGPSQQPVKKLKCKQAKWKEVGHDEVNTLKKMPATDVTSFYKQVDGHSPSAAPPRPERQRADPRDVVNHIVEGMKEQQTMKFILKVLSLYEELKAEMTDRGTNIRDVIRLSRHSAVDFYTALVQCVVRAHKPHLVEVLVDDMIQQGVSRPLVFYESAMKQLAGQKQYHAALSVYERLDADGLQPSPVTCSCLIGFAVEAGEYQRALGFFDCLSATSIPSIRAYMTILRVHGKRGDWTSSTATLQDMRRRNVPIDSLVLNTVLATGIGCRHTEAVSVLISDIEKATPQLLDTVSYNTLMKGCAQDGDAAGALAVLSRLRLRGLNPNAISFNTAMDACVRAARVADAWKVLEEMRAARWRPDKFSCSILVKGIAQCPEPVHVESGLQLLWEAQRACDPPLLSSMYTSLLEAASSTADSALFAKVYSQMTQQGVTPQASAQRFLINIPPAAGAGK